MYQRLSISTFASHIYGALAELEALDRAELLDVSTVGDWNVALRDILDESIILYGDYLANGREETIMRNRAVNEA